VYSQARHPGRRDVFIYPLKYLTMMRYNTFEKL
jgi:hypothetical protein